jgi:ADP-L-glycero-D-manno-heptose 6-epimerase
MIVVTGSAGFIASCLVSKLNNEGYNDVILVDDFSKIEKDKNTEGKKFTAKVERKNFSEWLKKNHNSVEFIFHLGARTDTTEFNKEIFDELNFHYSQEVWKLCTDYKIPLVYASSAATYGLGEHGYKDDHEVVEKLKPLNPYGDSKNDFDKWVLKQKATPPFWTGLKFFNVYGPNEYHKGRMASVVFHAFNQIQQNGKMKLFRSHDPKYKDGGQLRDFIYVKDVVNVCMFLMKNQKQSGLYNLGTGKAETFLALAESTFEALGLKPDIEFIDTPVDIRDKYQYFTEANMSKLRSIGYTDEFFNLKNGVADYVKNYLVLRKYY